MHTDMQRLNAEIAKHGTRQQELASANFNMEADFVARLKACTCPPLRLLLSSFPPRQLVSYFGPPPWPQTLELDALRLEDQIVEVKQDREQLKNSIVEAESALLLFFHLLSSPSFLLPRWKAPSTGAVINAPSCFFSSPNRRQIMLWDRKIELERETQEALDPTKAQVCRPLKCVIGPLVPECLTPQSDISEMEREIHRMQLRYKSLELEQEQLLRAMEMAIKKRVAIVESVPQSV